MILELECGLTLSSLECRELRVRLELREILELRDQAEIRG
jgi:hypothetical protein